MGLFKFSIIFSIGSFLVTIDKGWNDTAGYLAFNGGYHENNSFAICIILNLNMMIQLGKSSYDYKKNVGSLICLAKHN